MYQAVNLHQTSSLLLMRGKKQHAKWEPRHPPTWAESPFKNWSITQFQDSLLLYYKKIWAGKKVLLVQFSSLLRHIPEKFLKVLVSEKQKVNILSEFCCQQQERESPDSHPCSSSFFSCVFFSCPTGDLRAWGKRQPS